MHKREVERLSDGRRFLLGTRRIFPAHSAAKG
jgi:hypothetical protein